MHRPQTGKVICAGNDEKGYSVAKGLATPPVFPLGYKDARFPASSLHSVWVREKSKDDARVQESTVERGL